ncbi:MAG: helix-turn-helix domain-containing protein, partial [Thermomicrobiales bacterium]
MVGRPRTVTDAEILAAAERAIARHGPARLTLAHVAAEVGLTPPTLLQRFGSKRGLLLAVAARGADEFNA